MSHLLIFAFLLFTPLIVIGQERVTDISSKEHIDYFQGPFKYNGQLYFSRNYESIHKIYVFDGDTVQQIFKFEMESPYSNIRCFGFQDDYYFVQHLDQILIFNLSDYSYKNYNLKPEDAYTVGTFNVFKKSGTSYFPGFKTNDITKYGNLYHHYNDDGHKVIFRDYQTSKTDTLLSYSGYWLQDTVINPMVFDSLLYMEIYSITSPHKYIHIRDLKNDTSYILDSIPHSVRTRFFRGQQDELIYEKGNTIYYYNFKDSLRAVYKEERPNHSIRYVTKTNNSGYQVIVSHYEEDEHLVMIFDQDFKLVEENIITFPDGYTKLINIKDFILFSTYLGEDYIYSKTTGTIDTFDPFPFESSLNSELIFDTLFLSFRDNKVYKYNFYTHEVDSMTSPSLPRWYSSKETINNTTYFQTDDFPNKKTYFIKVKGSNISVIEYTGTKFRAGIGEYSRLKEVNGGLYLISESGLYNYNNENGVFSQILKDENITDFTIHNEDIICFHTTDYDIPNYITHTDLKSSNQTDTFIIYNEDGLPYNSNAWSISDDQLHIFNYSDKIFFVADGALNNIFIEYDMSQQNAKKYDPVADIHTFIGNNKDGKIFFETYSENWDSTFILSYDYSTGETKNITEKINALKPIRYTYHDNKFYVLVRDDASLDIYTLNIANGDYMLTKSIATDTSFLYDFFIKYVKNNHFTIYSLQGSDLSITYLDFETNEFITNQLKTHNIDAELLANYQESDYFQRLVTVGEDTSSIKFYFNFSDSLYEISLDYNFDDLNFHERSPQLFNVRDEWILSLNTPEKSTNYVIGKDGINEIVSPLLVKSISSHNSREIRKKVIEYIGPSKTKGSFIAILNTTTQGKELWEYSNRQFSPLAPIQEGVLGSHPNNFHEYEGQLFFTAFNTKYGYQVYKLDLPKDTTTSTEDINKNFFFSLYPNPSSDVINIYCNKNLTSYEILTVTGKPIEKGTLKRGTETKKIDISKLPASSYIILVQSETSGQSAQLFVKPD